MRNPENIRGVLAATPDYLGYIFYPKSKRFVGDTPHPSIFMMVPKQTKKVAVFVNENLDRVIKVCKKYQIEIAQLHGNENPEYCKEVKKSGILVFKAFSVDDQFDFSILENYCNVVDFFLFDTKGKLPGGTGMKFSWDILQNYKLSIPFFLSGGIAPEDIEQVAAFKHEQLFALDINSGFELEPALKDEARVQAFISQIKTG